MRPPDEWTSRGERIELSSHAEAGAGYGNNLAAHPLDNDNLDTSFSIRNAVKYTSANYAGLKFGGLYGFSNSAGDFSNNRAWSIGVSYDNGPLSVAAAYLQLNKSGSSNLSGAVSQGDGTQRSQPICSAPTVRASTIRMARQRPVSSARTLNSTASPAGANASIHIAGNPRATRSRRGFFMAFTFGHNAAGREW